MPLGRSARQRRARSQRTTSSSYTPRVDVFGTLRTPAGDEARGRLIEYARDRYAFFTAADPERPLLFEAESEMRFRGRIMTTDTADGELKFQKAGCGCETPHELRGSRRQLLAHVPIAAEELEQEAPDTVHALHMEDVPARFPPLERDNAVSAAIETFPALAPPTPDELVEALQHIPGTHP